METIINPAIECGDKCSELLEAITTCVRFLPCRQCTQCWLCCWNGTGLHPAALWGVLSLLLPLHSPLYDKHSGLMLTVLKSEGEISCPSSSDADYLCWYIQAVVTVNRSSVFSWQALFQSSSKIPSYPYVCNSRSLFFMMGRRARCFSGGRQAAAGLTLLVPHGCVPQLAPRRWGCSHVPLSACLLVGLFCHVLSTCTWNIEHVYSAVP